MRTHFEVEDAEWIAADAKKLWASEAGANESMLIQMLGQHPQPHLRMPEWIDFSLNPFSVEYRNQILRLWQALYDRGSASTESVYNIAEHEQDAAYDACPIRFPGYFARRDPQAVRHAGYEMAMLADVMVHSDLSSGKHVIEYGAGSGNIAINLARLGIVVDTVDISSTYCDHIAQNAEYYGIPLRSHNQEFGFSPRGENFKYDCIIFHACFHHSIDHAQLISKIYSILSDDGSIILSNEPIYDDFYCPWGLRTDPECISVIAGRGWMELGFKTEYLVSLFAQNGLILTKVENNFSQIPLYIARKIPIQIVPTSLVFGLVVKGHFGAEEQGAWLAPEASIAIVQQPGKTIARINLANLLPVRKEFSFSYRGQKGSGEINPHQTSTIDVKIDRSEQNLSEILSIKSIGTKPSDYIPNSEDNRIVGLMIRSIEYI